jgi:predicted Zn-dependent peptidase
LLAAALPEGTQKANAKQIAEAVQDCGGDLDARASADGISLETSVLAEKADAALSIFADVAEHAAFADEEVKIVKQNAASELQANEAEPAFLARRALYHAVFGSHPYRTIAANKETIQQTTAGELQAEFTRRFRPDRAVLVAVGDFDPKQLAAAIGKNFENWKAPATGDENAVEIPAASVTKTVVYVPRPDSVQTTLYAGALAPNLAAADHAAVDVANALFGGMFGSRLIKNIREDKGYTYSPYSYLASYAAAGLLATRADVRNAVTGASFNEITYELNRVATTAPESEELERAKRYLIGSMTIRMQLQALLAGQLAEYWMDGLKAEDLAREGEKVKAVTADNVEAAGAKYFPMSRMTIVAVGDENVIRQQLAPFGLELSKSQ